MLRTQCTSAAPLRDRDRPLLRAPDTQLRWKPDVRKRLPGLQRRQWVAAAASDLALRNKVRRIAGDLSPALERRRTRSPEPGDPPRRNTGQLVTARSRNLCAVPPAMRLGKALLRFRSRPRKLAQGLTALMNTGPGGEQAALGQV